MYWHIPHMSNLPWLYFFITMIAYFLTTWVSMYFHSSKLMTKVMMSKQATYNKWKW